MGRVGLLVAMVLAVPAAARADVPCAVTFSAAPPELQATIQSWVSSEPHCTAALVISVQTTDAGYAVTARDDRGHVHARTVPDADTAGVLIASWIADDSVAPPVNDAVLPVVRSAIVAAPAAEVAATVRVSPLPERHWLLVGGEMAVGPWNAVGVRDQIDLYTNGRWGVGLDTAFLYSERGSVMHSAESTLTSAAVYVAFTQPIGDWRVRAQLGIGGTLWHGVPDGSNTMLLPNEGVATAAYAREEGTLYLGHLLGRNWQVAAGPIVSHAQMTRVSLVLAVGYHL